MLAFAATFHRLVIPALRIRCRALGFQVALECMEFEDAARIILREARRRGAGFLDDSGYYELTDWVYSELLRQELSFEADIAAYRIVADRVERDIRRWEARLAVQMDAANG